MNAIGLISPFINTISNASGLVNNSASSSNFNGLTNLSINAPLFDKNRYLFSLYDSFGKGSYTFLENVNDGDNITIDRTQLRAYDETVIVSLPENGEYFAFVAAFEEEEVFSLNGGYGLCYILPFDNEKINSNILELGYLNSVSYTHLTLPTNREV